MINPYTLDFQRTPEGLAKSKIKCPKPCVDCDDGNHHWLEDFDSENGDVFMVCKHCDAWCDFENEPTHTSESNDVNQS